jgi:hypothetical protein
LGAFNTIDPPDLGANFGNVTIFATNPFGSKNDIRFVPLSRHSHRTASHRNSPASVLPSAHQIPSALILLATPPGGTTFKNTFANRNGVGSRTTWSGIKSPRAVSAIPA